MFELREKEEGIGINIEPEVTKAGLVDLVVTLAEILRDVLKRQAQRMIKKELLTDEEKEKLGGAFLNLEKTMEELKEEQEIAESVRRTRETLNASVYGDGHKRDRGQETLVGLLDALLNKGTVLHGDIILSLADVALARINLKAAIAGGVTMAEHEVMESREALLQRKTPSGVPLQDDEEVITSTFGSYWQDKTPQPRWKLGRFYITNKRLILFNPGSTKAPFEIPLKEIKGWTIRREEYHDKVREELYLSTEDGKIARLHAQDTRGLKAAIEEQMKALGLPFEEDVTLLSSEDKRAARFLRDDERIIHSGRMWYFASAAIISAKTATWKPGQLYLTSRRLCFWDDLMKRIDFEVPRSQIAQVFLEKRDFTQKTGVESARTVSGLGRGGAPPATKSKTAGSNIKKALVISSTDGKEAYFSGKNSDMQEWQKVLEEGLARF